MLMPPISAGKLPGGVNLFSSPPPNPRINDPYAPKPLPFPPIPRRKKPPNHNLNHKPDANPTTANRVLKSTHSRTKYYKPVTDGVITADGDRAVIVGESGVSYLLPGAPFEFQFSYSETPKVKPIAFREPAFLPFAPPTMPRPWTGKAPLKSKKEKELKRQKRVRLVSGEFNSFVEGEGGGKVMEMERDVKSLGEYHGDPRSRVEILGKPLTRAEVRALVKPFLSRNRQVNLGRDGLTHNMLDLIHSHWRRDKICKVRCRGVPTVDMDNVCHHLEERTGGKIIYQAGGIVYLFRGRNYDPRTRPRYPVMLWKPAAPVYPKLIQEAPEGLTKVEAEKMRAEAKKLLPICKLAKNGIYLNLVKDVRDAFEFSPLVKIDCQGLEPSDYKKIGAKLKDLVPCVLLSFDDEQILMWRGKDWKSTSTVKSTSSNSSAPLGIPGKSNYIIKRPLEEKENATPRMLLLWKEAIATKKALLLNDLALCPDALLEKVEDFESATQASEHSYKAVILSRGDGNKSSLACYTDDGSQIEINEDNSDADASYSDEYDDNDDVGANELLDDDLESAVTFDLMPVDIIARRLSQD